MLLREGYDRHRQAFLDLADCPQSISRFDCGEDLFTDVVYLGAEQPERLLLLTSGLHGVEGFFGSDVQTVFLKQFGNSWSDRPWGVTLVHGLNPYGFANLRRWNENNVDLNRNFLEDGTFGGAPAGFAELNSFLNPKVGQMGLPFEMQAVWLIARHGLRQLQHSISSGQYEFSDSLFFGGQQRESTTNMIAGRADEWLRGAQEIVHLDFHTGLGRFAEAMMITCSPISERLRSIVPESFCSLIRTPDADVSQGSFERWMSTHFGDRVISVCAEYGTYNPVKVLKSLRAENMAHHQLPANSPGWKRAKRQLLEAFYPSSANWRDRVTSHAIQLIRDIFEHWEHA